MIGLALNLVAFCVIAWFVLLIIGVVAEFFSNLF